MHLTYFNGEWAEGNTPLFGAMDHSVWLGSSVFDGARALRGHLPDLRLHLQRVITSAERVGLACPLNVDEMEKLVREGVAKFPPDAELYVRPLVFGTDGFLVPVPEKSAFALTLFDAPMPAFTGFSACLSAQLRPDALMAPTAPRRPRCTSTPPRPSAKRRSAASTTPSFATVAARWPSSRRPTCSSSRRTPRW